MQILKNLPAEYTLVVEDISPFDKNIMEFTKYLNVAYICNDYNTFVSNIYEKLPTAEDAIRCIKMIFYKTYLNVGGEITPLYDTIEDYTLGAVSLLFSEITQRRNVHRVSDKADKIVRDLSDLSAEETLVYRLVVEYPEQVLALKAIKEMGIDDIFLIAQLIKEFKVEPREGKEGDTVLKDALTRLLEFNKGE